MQGEIALQEEIMKELEDLKKMEVGSDEHKNAVDDVTKLIDRATKIESANAELNEQIKARRVQNGIAIVSGITSFAVLIWGTCKTIDFEKTGNFTTLAGRFFANKLFSKKYEYYGAAEPPVRCGESHLSGLTEPLRSL